MQRTFAMVVTLILFTGCGAGGKNALFSAGNTRVPPPGTKSYGKADNGYYNPNAPPGGVPSGVTNNTFGPPYGNAANSVATNGPLGDLNWRTPGSRSNTVVPASAPIAYPPSNSSRIAPATYNVSTESPVRVMDGGGSGNTAQPRLQPTPINSAMSNQPLISGGSEPAPFRASPDANEITQLPRLSSPPAIRAPIVAPQSSMPPSLNWRSTP